MSRRLLEFRLLVLDAKRLLCATSGDKPAVTGEKEIKDPWT